MTSAGLPASGSTPAAPFEGHDADGSVVGWPVHTRIAAVGAALFALFLAVTSTAAAGTPAPTAAPATTATADISVYAVTGTNGHVYARRTNETGYRALGGVLVGPPSVAVDPHTHAVYYVGLGANGLLYGRTDTLGWRQIGYGCAEPAAHIAYGLNDQGQEMPAELWVACRGADGHLRFSRAPVPESGLPFLGTQQDLGGRIQHGPSIGNDTNVYESLFYFEAVGINNLTYVRSERDGWRRAFLTCADSVALVNFPTGYAEGCAVGSERLRLVTAGCEPIDAGGRVVGRPGLALGASGYPIVVWVTGPNQGIYRMTVTRTGHLCTTSGFVREPGAARPGVGAAHLSP